MIQNNHTFIDNELSKEMSNLPRSLKRLSLEEYKSVIRVLSSTTTDKAAAELLMVQDIEVIE